MVLKQKAEKKAQSECVKKIVNCLTKRRWNKKSDVEQSMQLVTFR